MRNFPAFMKSMCRDFITFNGCNHDQSMTEVDAILEIILEITSLRPGEHTLFQNDKRYENFVKTLENDTPVNKAMVSSQICCVKLNESFFLYSKLN